MSAGSMSLRCGANPSARLLQYLWSASMLPLDLSQLDIRRSLAPLPGAVERCGIPWPSIRGLELALDLEQHGCITPLPNPPQSGGRENSALFRAEGGSRPRVDDIV